MALTSKYLPYKMPLFVQLNGQFITRAVPLPLPTLLSIAISGPASIREGSSSYYLLTGKYSDGSTLNLTSSASYSSSEGVYSNGLVTLPNNSVVGDGRVMTLTATYGGLSTTQSVTVLDTSLPAGSTPGTTTVRVLAGRLTGSPFVTTTGNTFALDQYFTPSPGQSSTNSTIYAGTVNSGIYQGYRFDGRFIACTVPVTNGAYTVTMHFAETYWTAPNKRVFDVTLQGTTVIPNYDIFAKVGYDTADAEAFNIIVTNGSIVAQVNVGAANLDIPLLCAVEIVPYATS
jgi:hypothetical protein